MDKPDATRSRPALLGVDWGTSNRRAYLVGRDGACRPLHADDQGVMAARPDFAGSLARLLAAMKVEAGVPVVASGMIGSAQGWREVPYLDIGVSLAELPSHLVRVDDAAEGREVLIVPGYCQRGERIDVMRGEETQLLGALALGQGDGWVVLPGTHSKWVLLQGGAIRHIVTFMTGELFATMGVHGTLAPLMSGPDDEDAFGAGVDEARRRAPLSNALFGVRARVVTGAMPAAHARSFVSGLLIGTEFVAAYDMLGAAAPKALASIGSATLHARYAAAAARFGVELTGLEPDRVYCAALALFLEEIGK